MKKLHKEDFIYLFILISPFLDIASCLLNFGSFSISVFLRPIIPACLLIYIFFKDAKTRKYLIISGLMYVIYCVIHLLTYNNLLTPFSYGSVIYEATYLCNYTYLIFTLMLFIYLFLNKKDNTKLKNTLLIYTAIYIISIYTAIITGTSLYTYVEGTGYKGWFNTGGAVGSILTSSLFILIPYIFENKDKFIYKIILLVSIIIYLTFFLGTRVGLLSGILAIICYIAFQIFLSIINKIKINKKIIITSLISIVVIVTIVLTLGSSSLDRRKELDDLTGKIPGDTTGETIYMAYDLVELKKHIDNNNVALDFMLPEQKEALNKLDKYTKKVKMASTDLRMQQLIYHHYLWNEQDSLKLKVFGNGYLTNMGMLTLEMEYIAIFYNFGIFGFILFCIPFLSIFVYACFKGIKNIKKLDINYLMLLAGCFMSYMISTLAGHTYFNTSVMIMIIVLHTLLLQKAIQIKKR